MPDRHMALRDLAENYGKDVRCVRILYHPTEYAQDPRQFDITEALMETGLVDAVEIINVASTLYGSQRFERTSRAANLFLRARAFRPHLAAVGSSDQHKQPSLGQASTFVPDGMDLFSAIRSGQTVAVNHARNGLIANITQNARSVGAGRFVREVYTDP